MTPPGGLTTNCVRCNKYRPPFNNGYCERCTEDPLICTQCFNYYCHTDNLLVCHPCINEQKEQTQNKSEMKLLLLEETKKFNGMERGFRQSLIQKHILSIFEEWTKSKNNNNNKISPKP